MVTFNNFKKIFGKEAFYTMYNSMHVMVGNTYCRIRKPFKDVVENKFYGDLERKDNTYSSEYNIIPIYGTNLMLKDVYGKVHLVYEYIDLSHTKKRIVIPEKYATIYGNRNLLLKSITINDRLVRLITNLDEDFYVSSTEIDLIKSIEFQGECIFNYPKI